MNRLVEAMQYLDDELITEALMFKREKEPQFQLKLDWRLLLIGLCVMTVLAVYPNRSVSPKDTPGELTGEGAPGSFESLDKAQQLRINGHTYQVIGIDDYAAYGLDYRVYVDGITKEQLGEFMGYADDIDDKVMLKLAVYHLKELPEDDTICIVEWAADNYSIYIKQ